MKHSLPLQVSLDLDLLVLNKEYVPLSQAKMLASHLPDLPVSAKGSKLTYATAVADVSTIGRELCGSLDSIIHVADAMGLRILPMEMPLDQSSMNENNPLSLYEQRTKIASRPEDTKYVLNFFDLAAPVGALLTSFSQRENVWDARLVAYQQSYAGQGKSKVPHHDSSLFRLSNSAAVTAIPGANPDIKLSLAYAAMVSGGLRQYLDASPEEQGLLATKFTHMYSDGLKEWSIDWLYDQAIRQGPENVFVRKYLDKFVDYCSGGMTADEQELSSYAMNHLQNSPGTYLRAWAKSGNTQLGLNQQMLYRRIDEDLFKPDFSNSFSNVA